MLLSSRKQVGDTTLWLPPLGYGAAHLGGFSERVPGDVARETLQAAWDGGVRYFDTAPFYGRGLSELRLGHFLVDQPRDSFVITTKIGRYLRRRSNPLTFKRESWAGGLNMEIVWSYSYDGIMRSYEQSLLRLGLDTVDALLIHDPEQSLTGSGPNFDDLTASGMHALDELKRTGAIRAIGMGLNETKSLETFAQAVPLDFVIVAMPYTLLDQSALRCGLGDCAERNVSVVIGAPYASGILATGPGPRARYGYRPAEPHIQEKTRRIQITCENHGVALPAAALQFPLGHPVVVSVIPGGVTSEEVKANIGHAQAEIPAQLWADLRAQGLIDLDAPTPS